MIISTGSGEVFSKIQHPFMIKKKNSLKCRHSRNISQRNKAHIQQTHTHSKIFLNGEKLGAFPLNLGA